MCVGAQGIQDRTLELELQAGTSCLIRVRGTKLGSCERAGFVFR